MSYGDIGIFIVVFILIISIGIFMDMLEVAIQFCEEDFCLDDLSLSIQVFIEICVNSLVQLGIDFEGQVVSVIWNLGGIGQISGLNL